MNFDNLTIAFISWGTITVAVMFAFAICKGCCIKKLMGKPCPE